MRATKRLAAVVLLTAAAIGAVGWDTPATAEPDPGSSAAEPSPPSFDGPGVRVTRRTLPGAAKAQSVRPEVVAEARAIKTEVDLSRASKEARELFQTATTEISTFTSVPAEGGGNGPAMSRDGDSWVAVPGGYHLGVEAKTENVFGADLTRATTIMYYTCPYGTGLAGQPIVVRDENSHWGWTLCRWGGASSRSSSTRRRISCMAGTRAVAPTSALGSAPTSHRPCGMRSSRSAMATGPGGIERPRARPLRGLHGQPPQRGSETVRDDGASQEDRRVEDHMSYLTLGQDLLEPSGSNWDGIVVIGVGATVIGGALIVAASSADECTS